MNTHMRLRHWMPALLLTAMLVAPEAEAALFVREAMSASGHSDPLTSGDWFEIKNTGPTDVDLDGYFWDDSSADVLQGATFPVHVLPAGFSVLVVEVEAADVAAWLAEWNDSVPAPLTPLTADDVLDLDEMGNIYPGLSGANGDEVYLFDDSEAEISAVVFGEATVDGASFQFAQDGTNLGQSTLAGGARESADGDIGSPVPEPGSLILYLIGSAAMLIRRPRRERRNRN
jgi:hypothetical protein